MKITIEAESLKDLTSMQHDLKNISKAGYMDDLLYDSKKLFKEILASSLCDTKVSLTEQMEGIIEAIDDVRGTG